jgi:hypothetical protein
MERNRFPYQFSPPTEKALLAYAAAATAAGIGALVGPTAAEAEIVYTPTHEQLSTKPLPVDLNHDGRADFFLLQRFYAGAGGISGALSVCLRTYHLRTYGYFCSTEAGSNARNEVRVAHTDRFAEALPIEVRIGRGDFPGGRQRDVVMGRWSLNPDTGTQWFGPWMNGGKGVKNRYLGLKFEINGEFHFGWARLTVMPGKMAFTVTLTGYAYETIAGKAIRAGQTKESDDAAGSLGGLAAGAVLREVR